MIEDIFSNKRKNQIKINEILIDFREKNSLVPSELIGMNQKIKFLELKIGDYLVNNILIERKNIFDLIQSIKNNRIFFQLKNMQNYKKSLLIIEGNIYSQKSISPNAIKGFILSTILDKKIPIIFTNTPKETARYLEILNKRKTKINNSHVKIKPKTRYEKQKYILESFSNIGPKTSEKLLMEFKSLNKIFTSKKEDLLPFLKKKTELFLQELS